MFVNSILIVDERGILAFFFIYTGTAVAPYWDFDTINLKTKDF